MHATMRLEPTTTTPIGRIVIRIVWFGLWTAAAPGLRFLNPEPARQRFRQRLDKCDEARGSHGSRAHGTNVSDQSWLAPSAQWEWCRDKTGWPRLLAERNK